MTAAGTLEDQYLMTEGKNFERRGIAGNLAGRKAK
jgi:hypothetical protein